MRMSRVLQWRCLLLWLFVIASATSGQTRPSPPRRGRCNTSSYCSIAQTIRRLLAKKPQYPVFLKRMMSQGKVAVAGPFPFAVPGELRGVAIFRITAEQTTKLMQDDAAVKAGVLEFETILGSQPLEFWRQDSQQITSLHSPFQDRCLINDC